jgi:hypothetical protein
MSDLFGNSLTHTHNFTKPSAQKTDSPMKTTTTNLAQTVSTLFDARMVRFPQVDTKLAEFADLASYVESPTARQMTDEIMGLFDKFIADISTPKKL